MSGHTPGKWDWAPATGVDDALLRPARVFVVAGGTSRDIAEVGCDRLKEADANARLLSCAPNTLDALKALMIAVREDCRDRHSMTPSVLFCLDDADAAVAKAEGRS